MDDNKDQKKSVPAKKPDPRNEEKHEGVLYIGIDLGTSRTSIASSNGIRESTFSVVGYPKDVVSKKLFNKDMLFGEEAIKNRLSLNILRPLEKGVIKGSNENGKYSAQELELNLNAARDLVKHAISLAKPRNDELIYGVIGCPAESSVKNKSYLIKAANEVLDSVMICSEPFAVAYGMDRFSDLLVIDIGAGTVDLCRMHGTLPEEKDQITLDMGGDYVDQELSKLISASHPEVRFTTNMIKNIKEKHSTVNEDTEPIVVELPVEGKPISIDITKEMVKACSSIIPSIVEALGKLIATFDPEFQHHLKDNVLIGGGGSQTHGLANAIEEEMKKMLGHGHVSRVEEPVFAGANGALKIAHDMPPEFWEQLK